MGFNNKIDNTVNESEIRIMEFKIDGKPFGINVAKIETITQIDEINPMPNAHPVVEGIFKRYDKVITIINLAKYLGLNYGEKQDRDIFIITNFSEMTIAFHVHSVVGIFPASWKEVRKPDSMIYGGEEGLATSIVEHEGRLITMLDFEKIIHDINPQSGIQVEDVQELSRREVNEKPILIVEDSLLLTKLIIDSLSTAGYTNIIKTNNGREAWQFLEEIKNSGETLKSHVALVISDIEMPQMDGITLTKRIKSDSMFKTLPVVLFSSLINEKNYQTGKDAGANEQVSKPEIANLVNILDKYLL